MLAEIDEIILLLDEIKKVYTQIFELSLKIKDSILQNNTEELDNLVCRQNILNMQVRDLEKNRLSVVRKIAENRNIDCSDVDISFLASLCDGKQRELLESLQREISKLIDKQIDINKVNGKLLESNLNYVHFVLDMTQNGGGKFQTYSLSGKNIGGRENGIIDTKI